MIVDFHNHTYPDKIAIATLDKLSTIANTIPYVNGTAQNLSEDIKSVGIDYAVVLPVATAPRQVEKINTLAPELGKSYPNLISFGAMHPDYENYKDELLRIKELGLKGIKLHPNYQGHYFDDISYFYILEEAFKNDLIVVVHAGIDIGLPEPISCGVEQISNVIDNLELRDEKLVLAHMGAWKQWDMVLEKIAGKNVYFDTSFSLGTVPHKHTDGFVELMDNNKFIQLVRAHGVDKILFGTDSPWGGHAEMLKVFNSLNLTKEEKDCILFKNAVKLLKI